MDLHRQKPDQDDNTMTLHVCDVCDVCVTCLLCVKCVMCVFVFCDTARVVGGGKCMHRHFAILLAFFAHREHSLKLN